MSCLFPLVHQVVPTKLVTKLANGETLGPNQWSPKLQPPKVSKYPWHRFTVYVSLRQPCQGIMTRTGGCFIIYLLFIYFIIYYYLLVFIIIIIFIIYYFLDEHGGCPLSWSFMIASSRPSAHQQIKVLLTKDHQGVEMHSLWELSGAHTQRQVPEQGHVSRVGKVQRPKTPNSLIWCAQNIQKRLKTHVEPISKATCSAWWPAARFTDRHCRSSDQVIMTLVDGFMPPRLCQKGY